MSNQIDVKAKQAPKIVAEALGIPLLPLVNACREGACRCENLGGSRVNVSVEDAADWVNTFPQAKNVHRDQPHDRWVTLAEAATVLRLDLDQAAGLVRKGLLRAVTIGEELLISSRSAHELVAAILEGKGVRQYVRAGRLPKRAAPKAEDGTEE